MMEFAKFLEKYFKEALGFRSPLYPCKNTARYIAMTWPHLVDPESVLYGGTGHFNGLQHVFGGINLGLKHEPNIYFGISVMSDFRFTIPAKYVKPFFGIGAGGIFNPYPYQLSRFQPIESEI